MAKEAPSPENLLCLLRSNNSTSNNGLVSSGSDDDSACATHQGTLGECGVDGAGGKLPSSKKGITSFLEKRVRLCTAATWMDEVGEWVRRRVLTRGWRPRVGDFSEEEKGALHRCRIALEEVARLAPDDTALHCAWMMGEATTSVCDGVLNSEETGFSSTPAFQPLLTAIPSSKRRRSDDESERDRVNDIGVSDLGSVSSHERQAKRIATRLDGNPPTPEITEPRDEEMSKVVASSVPMPRVSVDTVTTICGLPCSSGSNDLPDKEGEDDGAHGTNESKSKVPTGTDKVPTTLYIFQRDVYDEGMHWPWTPLLIAPSLLPSSGDSLTSSQNIPNNCVSSLRRVASVALYNMGLVLQMRAKADGASALHRRAYAMEELAATRAVPREGENSSSSSSNVDDGSVIEPTENAALILLRLGQALYHRGQLEEATQEFSDALVIGRKLWKSESKVENSGWLTLAAILNCLGVCHYHSRGQNATTALGFCQEALDIQRKIVGEECAEVATTLNNIGRIHDHAGEFGKALECYHEALRIRRMVLADDDIDVAATTFNIGETYHTRNDLDRAMTYYNKFLERAEHILGPKHRDVATTLNNIGLIHAERGEPKMAMELFQRALEARRSSLGSGHPDVAAVLNKIGNLHHKNGDHDMALKCYKEGLEIEKTAKDDANIDITLNNMANLLQTMKKNSEAIDVLNEVLRRRKALKGDTHLEIADTMHSLGQLYFAHGNLFRALDLYRKSLAIRRAELGDDHQRIAEVLYSIGLALFRQRKHDEAMHTFMESLQVRRKLMGQNHPDVAASTYNVGLIYHRGGFYLEAMEFYQQTLSAELATLGRDHNEVALTLFSIGLIHGHMGDHDEAMKVFLEVLRIERLQLGEEHVHVARTLNNIGNIHLIRGEVGEAILSFIEALRIFRKAGMEDETLCVEGLSLYSVGLLHPSAAPAA